MPRLSIELTPEQHKRLKAITEEEALRQFEALLRPRLEEAESGKRVSKSARDIFDAVRKRA